MKKIVKKFTKSVILKKFFLIDLSSIEKENATVSLDKKYIPAIYDAIRLSSLSIPMVLFIDTSILTNILIPITIVSGTAWFSISLASIKKKFEMFGIELTMNMYRSFATSLMILFIIAMVSLNPIIFGNIQSLGVSHPTLPFFAGMLGIYVVFDIIYQVFIGSLKYDINDSMLAGQAELAEKFFKKSISTLYDASKQLKASNDLSISCYYLGLAMGEVFQFALQSKGINDQIVRYIDLANDIKLNPLKEEDDIKQALLKLVRGFLLLTKNISNQEAQKNYKNIKLELKALEGNNENQQLSNSRYATILSEIVNMLDNQGESLFTTKRIIEEKHSVLYVPKNISGEGKDIIQGYLKSQGNEEKRVRKIGDQYIYSEKKILEDGSSEDIEIYISKEKFETLWEQTKGMRIEKKRFILSYTDYEIRLDIFLGENKGLILAEVAFDNEEVKKHATFPKWIGKKITDTSQYKNKNLAK